MKNLLLITIILTLASDTCRREMEMKAPHVEHCAIIRAITCHQLFSDDLDHELVETILAHGKLLRVHTDYIGKQIEETGKLHQRIYSLEFINAIRVVHPQSEIWTNFLPAK